MFKQKSEVFFELRVSVKHPAMNPAVLFLKSIENQILHDFLRVVPLLQFFPHHGIFINLILDQQIDIYMDQVVFASQLLRQGSKIYY